MKSSRRRYHLGLDWGTSTTKLVLRDYEQGKAFVLFPSGNSTVYRYPSTVALSEKHIFFGIEAETLRRNARVFDGLKANIYRFSQRKTKDNSVPTDEDVATLYMAHVISIGLDFAEKHAGRGKAEAVMGMTLGVPAEELDKSNLRNIYTRMVRTAYETSVRIGYDPQGKKYRESQEVLKTAQNQIAERDMETPLDQLSYAQWLRPEMAAAMYWAIKSPVIEADLYSCVDIGAWTINASYFRIHGSSGNEKGKIAFYGGACQPPGVIELLKMVANDLNRDFIFLVGEEGRYLSQRTFSHHVNRFRDQCFSIWQKGFRKAYEKEVRQSAWDGKLNVMVVGGGSKIEKICQKFYTDFPHQGWKPPKPVPDLGVPTDLYNFPKDGVIPREPFRGDYTFLLVAYGLSVHSGDFPKTTLAPAVPPLPPEKRCKRFITSEELGYEER